MYFVKAFAILFAPIIAVSTFACFMTVPAAVSSPETVTVVIDAGHGGIDGGVTGKTSGVKEADINLEVAKKIKKLFDSAGVKAVMTRETSAGLYGALSKGFKLRDLQARVKIADDVYADAFISVHMNNCGDDARRGAQVYFKPESEKSKLLAESLSKSISALKGSARDCQTVAGDYYVLNNSSCPAVICECGFLSNAEDEALLQSDDYLESIAYAVFAGAIDFLAEKTSEYRAPAA